MTQNATLQKQKLRVENAISSHTTLVLYVPALEIIEQTCKKGREQFVLGLQIQN